MILCQSLSPKNASRLRHQKGTNPTIRRQHSLLQWPYVEPNKQGNNTDPCELSGPRAQGEVYIIDMDTTYNMLIGILWIHSQNAVALRLHQMVHWAKGSTVFIAYAEDREE